MDAVSAECVSVTPCGLEVPVIVLWTTAHVWRATSRSVTAEERVNVALANALTPNSRVPPVRPALPVQESVLNTSKSEMKTCHCTNTNTNTHMYVISYVLQESFLLSTYCSEVIPLLSNYTIRNGKENPVAGVQLSEEILSRFSETRISCLHAQKT